jgi:hypothetical protein
MNAIWKQDVYREGNDIVVHDYKESFSMPTAPSAYTYYMYGHDDPPGSNAKDGGPLIGISINGAVATPAGGYSLEGGFLLSKNGKEGTQYVTHGPAYGLELSASWNLVIINPYKNFKFNDLKGMGVTSSVNLGMFSINILGNTSPGYPENNIFNTYWGIEIGIGPSFGKHITVSFSPASTTSFVNWIPDFSKKEYWWGYR